MYYKILINTEKIAHDIITYAIMHYVLCSSSKMPLPKEAWDDLCQDIRYTLSIRYKYTSEQNIEE